MRSELSGVDPFWVATRHEDILEISRQNDLFHNGDRAPTLHRPWTRRCARMMGGSPHLLRTLIHMDAPDHPKYRALTQGWFMPQNMRRLEDQIRVIAKRAVATDGGPAALRLRQGSGAALPAARDHEHHGRAGGRRAADAEAHPGAVRRADPDWAAREGRLDGEQEFDFGVIVDFSNYFRALSEKKRANPTDDLASLIANSQVDGQPISDLEAMSYYIIVATAGHDTTSSSTAGASGPWARTPRSWPR